MTNVARVRLFGRNRATLSAAAVPAAVRALPIESPWAPTDALDVVTWAGLYDVDGLPVTRQQVIALPAVARGRDLIAQSVGRFPLFAVNAAGRLTNQPRVCQQPEVGRARFTTITWTVDDLIFEGLSWWIVVDRYATDLRPRTVRRVPPSQAEVDSAGYLTRAFGQDVNQFDVIRIDGPHEGILRRANETVRNARQLARRYAQACSTPTPDVELHQVNGDPLTNDQIDELIARWVAARQGKNGGVAFTNQSVEAKYNGQQPEQLLTSGRDAMNLDLARHMNLPAWAVDAPVNGTSLTYTNVPSRSRELIDYTLAGYMESITGRLSLDDVLAAGTWAAFSTDVLTDGDFLTRMQGYKAAQDAGVYDADWARAHEAGVPVEGAPTQQGAPA